MEIPFWNYIKDCSNDSGYHLHVHIFSKLWEYLK